MNLNFIISLFGGYSGIAKAAIRSITDRIKEGAVDTDIRAAADRIATLPEGDVASLCRWAGITDPAQVAQQEQLVRDAGDKYGQFLEALARQKLGKPAATPTLPGA